MTSLLVSCELAHVCRCDLSSRVLGRVDLTSIGSCSPLVLKVGTRALCLPLLPLHRPHGPVGPARGASEDLHGPGSTLHGPESACTDHERVLLLKESQCEPVRVADSELQPAVLRLVECLDKFHVRRLERARFQDLVQLPDAIGRDQEAHAARV